MSQESTASNVDVNNVPNPNDPNVNNVPPSDQGDGGADRIKKDMLKYKDENAQLRAQLEAAKLNSHKEKEDWKSVAEHHEQQANEYKTKYTGLQQALVNEKKVSALRSEAIKAGINPQSLPDLELLDFDEVSIETTSTGKILVSGQDRAIAKLKTMRPHWFTNSVPSVNPATPNVGKPNSDTVTVADLNAAEAQWKKTKSESDKKQYEDLIRKYKSQRT